MFSSSSADRSFSSSDHIGGKGFRPRATAPPSLFGQLEAQGSLRQSASDVTSTAMQVPARALGGLGRRGVEKGFVGVMWCTTQHPSSASTRSALRQRQWYHAFRHHSIRNQRTAPAKAALLANNCITRRRRVGHSPKLVDRPLVCL